MNKTETQDQAGAERVRVMAPAGHTHAGQTLAKEAEIVLRREQAERFGFKILGPAKTDDE